MNPLKYFIGLDLGQATDYTAVAVLERPHVTLQTPTAERRPIHTVRYLKRFALGTSYPEIIEDVRVLLQTPELFGSLVMIDQTGVGKAIVNLLMDGLRNKVTATLWPVTLTAGNEFSSVSETLIPKKELVGVLQALLQTRRLQIPRALEDAYVLVKELENFKARVTLKRQDPLEDWREGDHDDLVLALGLAAWVAETGLPDLYEAPPPPIPAPTLWGGRRYY